MNRLVIAMSCGALAASHAWAIPPSGATVSHRHQAANQVVLCMKRRMYEDRLISYNEATRLCKEEVSRQIENGELGPLVAADTQTRR
jgi:hypothetical protein